MRQLVQDYHGHKGKEISSDKVDGAIEHYGEDYENHIRDMYSNMGEELSDETLTKLVDNYDLGKKEEEAPLKEPEVLSDEVVQFMDSMKNYRDEIQSLNNPPMTNRPSVAELSANKQLAEENIPRISGEMNELSDNFKYSPVSEEKMVNHIGKGQDDVDEVSQQVKLGMETYTADMNNTLNKKGENLPESVKPFARIYEEFGVNSGKVYIDVAGEHVNADGKKTHLDILMTDNEGGTEVGVTVSVEDYSKLSSWIDLKSTTEEQKRINNKSIYKYNDFRAGLNSVARKAKDEDKSVKDEIIKYYEEKGVETPILDKLRKSSKFSDYDTVVSTSLWNTKETSWKSLVDLSRGLINEFGDTLFGEKSTTYNKQYQYEFEKFLKEDIDEDVRKLMYGTPKSKYDGSFKEIQVDVDGTTLILDDKENVIGARKENGNQSFDLTGDELVAIEKYNRDKEGERKYVENARMERRQLAWVGKGFQVMTDMIPIIAGTMATGGAAGLAGGTFLVSYSGFYEEQFKKTGSVGNATSFAIAATTMTMVLEGLGGFEGNLLRQLGKDKIREAISIAATKAAAKKLTKGETMSKFILKEFAKQMPEEVSIEYLQSFSEALLNIGFNGRSDLSWDELEETGVLALLAAGTMISVGSSLQFSNDMLKHLDVAARDKETFNSLVDEWVKLSPDDNIRVIREREAIYKKKYVAELADAINAAEDLGIKNKKSLNSINKKAAEVARAKMNVEEAKSEKSKGVLGDKVAKLEGELQNSLETSRKKITLEKQEKEILTKAQELVEITKNLTKEEIKFNKEFGITPDSKGSGTFSDKFKVVDDFEAVHDEDVTDSNIGEEGLTLKLGKLSEKPNEKGEHYTEGIVHDADGKVVGQYSIYGDTPVPNTVEVSSEVSEEHQGKGISTQSYTEIANQTGKPVIPGSISRDSGVKGSTFSLSASKLWASLHGKGIAEEVYVVDDNGKTIKTLAVLPEGFESNENVQRVEDYTGENTTNVEADTFTQEEEVESNFEDGTFTIIRNIKGKKIPQKLTFVKFNRDADGNIISVSATNFKGKNKTVRSPEIIAQLEQDKILFDNKLTEEGNEITTEELEQATEESIKAGEVTTEESEAKAEESDKGDDGTIQSDRTGKDTKKISEEQEFEEGDRESILGENANYGGIFGKVRKNESGDFYIKVVNGVETLIGHGEFYIESVDGTKTVIEGVESTSTNKELGLTKGITKVQEVENIIKVKKERRKELRKKLKKLYDKVYDKVDPDSKSQFVQHIFGLVKGSPLSNASQLANAFKGIIPAGVKESLGEELLSEVGPIADEFNNLNKELSKESLKDIRKTARIADAARETKRIKSERVAKLKEFKKRSKAKKAPKEKVEPKPKSKPKAKKKSAEPKKKTKKDTSGGLPPNTNQTVKRVHAKTDGIIKKAYEDSSKDYEKKEHRPIREIQEEVRGQITSKEEADAVFESVKNLLENLGGERINLILAAKYQVTLLELVSYYRDTGYLSKELDTMRYIGENTSKWGNTGHAMRSMHYEDLLSKAKNLLAGYLVKEQGDIDSELENRVPGILETLSKVSDKINLSEEEIKNVLDKLPMFKKGVESMEKNIKDSSHTRGRILTKKGDALIKSGLEKIRKSGSSLTVGGISPDLIEGIFQTFSGLMYKVGGSILKATAATKKAIKEVNPSVTDKMIGSVISGDSARVTQIKIEVEFAKIIEKLGKTPSNKTTLDPITEVVKILTSEVRKSLPKSSKVSKTPYEVVKEQLENKSLNRTLIDTALAQINLMPEGIKKSQLTMALNNIAIATNNGDILMKSALERAITRGRVDIGVSIKELVIDHYSGNDEKKHSLKSKIITLTGLSGKQVDGFSKLLDEEILKYIKANKTAVLDNMLKKHIKSKSKRQGYISKMFDAIRLGAFEEATLIKQFAEKHGTIKIDAKSAIKISELMAKIENETNPHRQTKLERVVLREVKNLKSTSAARTMEWIQTHSYVALLSNVYTQFNAGIAAFFSVVMESHGVMTTSMVNQGSYGKFLKFRKDTKGLGLEAGIGMAIQAFYNGASNFSIEEVPTDGYSDFDFFMNQSKGELWENFKNANGGLKSSIELLKTGYYASMKLPTHLFRMLISFDLILKSGSIEKAAYYEANTQLLEEGVNDSHYIDSGGNKVEVERSSYRGQWVLQGTVIKIDENYTEESNKNAQVVPYSKEFNDELNKMLGISELGSVKKKIDDEISDAELRGEKLEYNYRQTRMKEEVLKARNGDVREAAHQRILESLMMSNEIKGALPGAIAFLLYLPKRFLKNPDPVVAWAAFPFELMRLLLFPIVKVTANSFSRQIAHSPLASANRALMSLFGGNVDSISYDVLSGKWKFNGLTTSDIKLQTGVKKLKFNDFYSKEGKIYQTLQHGITERGQDGKLRTIGGKRKAIERKDSLKRIIMGVGFAILYMLHAYDLEEDEEGITVVKLNEDTSVQVTGEGLGFVENQLNANYPGFKENSILFGGRRGFHVRVGDMPIGFLFHTFGKINDRLLKGGKVTLPGVMRELLWTTPHAAIHGNDIGIGQYQKGVKLWDKFSKELDIKMDKEKWELEGNEWISASGKKATLEQSTNLDIKLDLIKERDGYKNGDIGEYIGNSISSRITPRLYSGGARIYEDIYDIPSPKADGNGFFDGLNKTLLKGIPVLSNIYLEETKDVFGNGITWDQDMYFAPEWSEDFFDNMVSNDKKDPVSELVYSTDKLSWGDASAHKWSSTKLYKNKYMEESSKKLLQEYWTTVFREEMLETNTLNKYKSLVSEDKIEEANKLMNSVASKVVRQSRFRKEKAKYTKTFLKSGSGSRTIFKN